MKKRLTLLKRTNLYYLIFLLPLSAFGDNGEAKASIFDLLTYREVLDVTLKADFDFLKNNRYSKDSHQAHLTFKDEFGELQSWDLKVKLRGAFRRVKCSGVPPLKLNFRKSALKAAGLSGFDDLKLVPQCMEGVTDAKDLVLKEYLSYKLYNDISDYSYRVQLLKITYKDTATGKKEKQWAFLIEDTAQLRSRIGAEKGKELYNLPADSFHLVQARTLAVFEYMIGNADWGFHTAKNVKFLHKKGKILPVPYDFDFSGLVDASYAAPNRSYGQTTLQDRVYLGFLEHLDQLHGTIYHFVGKQSKLEAVIMDFKPLNYEARLEMVNYLKGFFENPEDIKRGEVVYLKAEPQKVLSGN